MHNTAPLRAPALFLVFAAAIVVALPASAQEGDWYGRLGVFAGKYRETSFKDEDCNATSPAALYGCGEDASGRAIQSFVDFRRNPGVQIGIGHRINNTPFRVEGSLEHQRSLRMSGRTNFLAPERRQDITSEMDVTSLTLWGFVDSPQVVEVFGGGVNLFAGVGVGMSHISAEKTIMDFPATYTVVPGGKERNLAFGVTAGVSHRVSERIMVDLAWRHMDYGDIGTEAGSGSVVWRDGSRTIPLDLAPTKGKLRGNEMSLSMRYLF